MTVCRTPNDFLLIVRSRTECFPAADCLEAAANRRGHMVSDATARVGDTVSDLAAKTEEVLRDKIDQGKPVLRDLQAGAGAAIDKVAGLARDASSAGVQAVAQASDAIQGAAREVGNKVDQAATAAYQQGARAGGYVSRY